MAGETLSYTELKNWYDTFNDVISNYGGSLTTKVAPSSDNRVIPDDINNLFTAINEMTEEEYLGTQPTLYDTDYSIIASENKILRSAIAPINNTVNKIVDIKCRNKATCNSGANGDGNYSNGTHGNTRKSNGTKGNSTDSNAGKSYTCQNGSNSNGSNSNGTQSNEGNSHGTKSNGTKIDILNANTSI